jgi:hypothetical protein
MTMHGGPALTGPGIGGTGIQAFLRPYWVGTGTNRMIHEWTGQLKMDWLVKQALPDGSALL